MCVCKDLTENFFQLNLTEDLTEDLKNARKLSLTKLLTGVRGGRV